MTLTSKPLAVIILVILFGGIIIATLMGAWQTESSKTAATFTDGEFAGQANPADIRGSYTFGDVEKNFNIPATLLAQAFNIQTNDPASFAVKELETTYATSEFEIGTASVRLFVAFYNGLPIDLSTDMYLPENAAMLLKQRTLSPEQASYLEAHTVPNPAADPSAASPVPAQITEPAPSVESTDRVIKGKTTFQEILDWGVPQGIIEQVIGFPMPNPLTKVKDFCTEKGLDFETIKTALQVEVDKANQ